MRSGAFATRAAAAVLLLAAYLVPLALRAPLMDEDEGLHAAIAQEMVERGDWTTPRLLGEPFRDKPVLYFWLEAASLRALGANEAAVRLPGTLLVLAGAAATGLLAADLAGGAVGALAAAFTATMLLPFTMALVPVHDVALLPLAPAVLLTVRRAVLATRPSRRVAWAFAAGVLLGASVLAKGLVLLAVCGVTITGWLTWTRRWSWGAVTAGVLSIVALGLVAWPWLAHMEAVSPGYLRYYFFERHVLGFATETQPHAGRNPLYYVPVLLGGALPWTALARRPRPAMPPSREADADRLAWSWLIAGTLLITAAASKLASYALPVVPALAVLAALAVGRAPGAWTAHGRYARVVVGGALMTPLLVAVGVAWRYQLQLGAPSWAVLAALALSAAATPRLRSRDWAVPVAATAAAMLACGVLVMPVLAAQRSGRDLARAFNAEHRVPRQVGVVDEGFGSVIFYLDPALRAGLRAGQFERLSKLDIADRVASGAPDEEIEVRATRLDVIEAAVQPVPLPIARAGAFFRFRAPLQAARR